MSKRLLVSFAHPDDESFGIGALIAKYVAEGVEVSLICATNGDVGTITEEKMNGHDSVAAVRLAELECATKVLGFKEVIRFGYRDSGMMGTADNQHPNSLWSAPLEEVTDKVAEVIRRIRPQVVITFDPFGGYGHPDHIKMNQATLEAFRKVQRADGYPQKLYYPAFPRGIIRLGVFMMRLLGRDPRHAGTNKDLDFQAVLDATQPTHARVDVSRYYEIGQQAAECHASQGNPRRMVPLARILLPRLTGTTSLTRVEPPPVPGEPIEHDLFKGVTMS